MAFANPDEFEVVPKKPAVADPNDFEVVASPSSNAGPESTSPAQTDQVSAVKSAPVSEQIEAIPSTVGDTLAQTGDETAAGVAYLQGQALDASNSKLRDSLQHDAERRTANARLKDHIFKKLSEWNAAHPDQPFDEVDEGRYGSGNEEATAHKTNLQEQQAHFDRLNEGSQASQTGAQLSSDAAELGETKAPGKITSVVRGLTKGASMAAEAAIPGVGTAVMASSGASQAYGQAKAAGKSEQEASDSGARTLLALAAFGGSNKVVSGTVAKLLGNAPALKTFLVQTLGQTAGNEATSRVIAAYEAANAAPPGKKIEAAKKAAAELNLESFAQNLGFGAMGGLHAAGEAAPSAPSVPDFSKVSESDFPNIVKKFKTVPDADPRKAALENEIIRRDATRTATQPAQAVPVEAPPSETPQTPDVQPVSQPNTGTASSFRQAQKEAAEKLRAAVTPEAKELAPATAEATEKLAEAIENTPPKAEVETPAPQQIAEKKAPAEEAVAPKESAPAETTPQSQQEVPGASEQSEPPVNLTPAVKTDEGIAAGENHPEIIEREGLEPEVRDTKDAGFVTDEGDFKTREQAAEETGLPTNKEEGKLHSSDLLKKTFPKLDEFEKSLEDEPAPKRTAEMTKEEKLSRLEQELKDAPSRDKKAIRARIKALSEEPVPEVDEPEPVEQPKEIWQKTRDEVKSEGGSLARHSLEVKAALKSGEKVPLEVLEDFKGREWADNAREKIYGQEVSDTLLGRIAKALEDDPTKLYSDPLLIQTIGKPVLRQAVKVLRASLEAGKLAKDAVEDAIAYLKANAPSFTEEKVRTLLGNLVSNEDQTKGGDSDEKGNEEKGKKEGVLTPPGEGEEVPSQSPEPEDHAAYNAETDKALEKAGFAPIAGPARKTLGDSWNEALAATAKARLSGEDLGGKLVDELNAKPRTLKDDVESGVLLKEIADRKKIQANAQARVDEAAASGDEATQAEAVANLNLARDRTYEAITAAKKTGTEWGRAGRFRQIHIDDDYNITSMEAKVRSEVNNGKPLTEKQAADIKASAEEIEKAKKYDEMMESAKKDAEAATVADDLQKQVSKQAEQSEAKGKGFLDFIHEQAANARKRIIARRGAMYMAVDPVTPIAARFVDETIIGASYIADKIVDFSRWSRKMISDFGPRVSPHLPEIFKLASEKNTELQEQHAKANDPEQSNEKEVAKLVSEQKSAGLYLNPKIVYDLAVLHAKEGVGKQGGVEGMNELMKAVHADLAPAREGLTERDVRDAFSGYGKVKHPSKDQIATQLREVRRLGQLQSGIEDALNKTAPKKSGMQRDNPTQAVRDKMKELQATMRASGIETVSPEQQLASANAARERAIQNRIEDIRREIETGQKPPKSPAVPDSPKVVELKKERDGLQKQLDDINEAKKEKKTPEQMANETRAKALRKSIEEIDARLKGKENPLRRTPIPDSPEVESLRAERDAMREKLDEIENPPRDPAEVALQNAIKATRKSIEGYDAMLKSGDISPKEKSQRFTPSDELETLQSERDALRQAVTEMRNEAKPKTSPEERARKSALSALDKRIAELERRLKTGDISKAAKGKDLAGSFVDVRAKRNEAKRLQETLNELKKQKNARTPEQIQNERYRTLLAKRKADLEARLAKGDFTKPVRNKLQLDRESEQAKADYERTKQKFDTEVEKQRRANLSRSQKFWDGFVSVERAMKLTSAAVFGKLGVAAAARAVLTPIEEGVGAAIGKALPGLEARSPRQGKLSPEAESKAFASMFTSGMKDAYNNLRMKKSNLDVLNNRNRMRDIPPAWYEYMGFLHAAMKAPIKRAEFERSLAKRIQFARENGQDITDPNVMTALSQSAYVDANRSIFMQDNWATKGFSGLKRIVEGAGAPGAARLMQFLVPIVKVPTNIVGEAYEGTPVSLAHAAAKTAKAYMKGIDQLPPEEADVIMRQLKKGLIGTAALTFGYLAANSIGGFYRKGEKRKDGDLKSGEYKIGGEVMPKWFGHTPIAMLMNLGATAARARKEGAESGVIEGTKGFAREVPFVPAVTNLIDALGNENSTQRYVASMIAGTAEPSILPQIARAKDTPGTLPKNILTPARQRESRPGYVNKTVDELKLGIPGLREQVPLRSRRRLKSIR